MALAYQLSELMQILHADFEVCQVNSQAIHSGKWIFSFLFCIFTFFQVDLKPKSKSQIKIEKVFFCIKSSLLRK
jgi:hypothetical protein